MTRHILLVSAMLAAASWANEACSQMTGAELLDLCQEVPLQQGDKLNAASTSCIRYSEGAVEGFMFGYRVGKGKHQEGFCFPDGATNIQLSLVVLKYLQSHPEKLHERGAILVLYAAREGFPCQ